MKYIFLILCALQITAVSPVTPGDEPDSTQPLSIIVTMDGEDVREVYDHQPDLLIRMDESTYAEEIEAVLYDEEQGVSSLLPSVWVYDEEEQEWQLHWKFDHDVKNMKIQVRNKEEVVYESIAFSVESGLMEPQFYVKDVELKSGERYTYDEDVHVIMKSKQELDIEKTILYRNGTKQELLWKEDHHEAEFILHEDIVHTFSYKLVDISGNILEEESDIQIFLDHDAPSVTLYMNDVLIDSEFAPFYDRESNLSIEVNDRSFRVEESQILINDRLEEVFWKKQEDKYVAKITLQDGTYTIAYDMYDEALHHTARSYASFTIDTQKPEIALKFLNDELATSQTVEVHMRDKAIDSRNSTFHVVRNGQLMNMKPDWIADKEGIHAFIKFEEEGTYSVYAYARDHAGHELKSERQTFVIDRTPPAVSLFYNQGIMQEHMSYLGNRDVTIDMRVQDTNGVHAVMTLYKNGVLQLQQDMPDTFHIPAGVQHNDDYYLIIEACDSAGNISRNEYTFAIHTMISPVVIANDVFKGKPYSGSWKPQITVSGDDYHVINVMLYRNRELIDYHWSDEISAEGNYMLEITVEDRARNHATLSSPFFFTIDKTPPSLVLLHLENGGIVQGKVNVNERYALVIDPYDQQAQAQAHFVNIRINGLAAGHVPDNVFYFQPDHTGSYLIEADVVDDAGNKAVYTWNIEAVHEQVTYKKPEKKVYIPEKKMQTETAVSSTSSHVSAVILFVAAGVIVVAGSILHVRKRKH